MGASASMIVSPFISLCMGFGAGVISCLGFNFLPKVFLRFLRYHDSAGVMYLHLIPGFIGGLCAALIAGVTTEKHYGDDINTVFNMMGPDYSRGHSKQGGIQIAALFTSLGIGCLAGAFTGLVMRIPVIWNAPVDLFNDKEYWRFSGGDHDEKLNIDEVNEEDERKKKEEEKRKIEEAKRIAAKFNNQPDNDPHERDFVHDH